MKAKKKVKKKTKVKTVKDTSAWRVNMCVLFACLSIIDPDRWGNDWIMEVWAEGFTKSERAKTKEKIAKVYEVLNS